MANMDQSFLLELDANLSPTILIRQLLLRLECYRINKAARPLRMNDPVEQTEEEGGGEETEGGGGVGAGGSGGNALQDPSEVEEALSGLQIKRRLSGKFKWRRSKCSGFCPVSLRDGRIVQGRQEFAAAFLDKVYMMADELALRAFLHNPRPFLSLPQPRAPCKLSVLGPKFSGKTTLSSVIAKKYNAAVIDMDYLMEPKLTEAREAMLARTKTDATQQAIETIKNKYKDKMEQEKRNIIKTCLSRLGLFN
jgi:adenylate/nucleoside-diphosphate kinase